MSLSERKKHEIHVLSEATYEALMDLAKREARQNRSKHKTRTKAVSSVV